MSVIAKFRKGQGGASNAPEAGPDPAAAAKADRPALSAMDRTVRQRTITPLRVGAAVAVLAIIGVGGYAYLHYGLEPSLAVSTDRLTLSVVVQAPFQDYVQVNAVAAPKNTVLLDTVEGGQVTQLEVEDGADVSPGQVLAHLKNTRLELEVLGDEAQLTQQQNILASSRLTFQQSDVRNDRDLMELDREIERTQDQLKRSKPLENEGIAVSTIHGLEVDLERQTKERKAVAASQDEQRELANRNLVQIQAAVDRMTASLQLVRGSLNNLNVAAPIAGQLTGFNLNVGQVIAPSQRIGQIDSIDTYKMTAQVDEFYLGRVAVGQRGSVEIGDMAWTVRVSKVYPDVHERQFQVDLVFDGASPEGLRRGQSVRPRIELGEPANALQLENGPYYEETGGGWVMVLSADGKTAMRRTVTLGRRNPEAIEVVSGLRAGEQVITSSYQDFKAVERVDLDKPARAKGARGAK